MVLIDLDLQGHLDIPALIQKVLQDSISNHNIKAYRSWMELYIVQFEIDLQGHLGVILTISFNVDVG